MLEDLFGDGAKIIEEKVVRSLYTKIGMEYVKKENCTFPEYVKEAYRKQLKHGK